MEHNLKQKVETYCHDFKDNIQEWFKTNNCKIISSSTNEDITNSSFHIC